MCGVRSGGRSGAGFGPTCCSEVRRNSRLARSAPRRDLGIYPIEEPAIPRDMLPLVKRAFEGKYQVEREIGKGGNARIFLATDRQGQQVALKVLHPELLVSVA